MGQLHMAFLSGSTHKVITGITNMVGNLAKFDRLISAKDEKQPMFDFYHQGI